MNAPTHPSGGHRTGLLGRLGEGWRDYRYLSRRRAELHRPWLYQAPLHWVHHPRTGWRLHGRTLPEHHN